MTYDIHLIYFKTMLFRKVNIYARDIYIVLSTKNKGLYEILYFTHVQNSMIGKNTINNYYYILKFKCHGFFVIYN